MRIIKSQSFKQWELAQLVSEHSSPKVESSIPVRGNFFC